MKRLLDFLFASCALLLLSPLLLWLAWCVARDMGRPVLFKQERIGKGGKPFCMIKFRSMREAFDPNGDPLSDSDRLTMLGKKLRESSVDELPELWNVLRGEMSLVGPRPLLVEYLPLYSDAEARRHEVLPGITGWAQVKGRNLISWDEKFALDVWYVDNRTIWLDLKIICITVYQVLNKVGISAKNDATMVKFRGSKKDVS